ncbi:MAG: hypothetical protein M3R63_06420 [Actinomycetota bacterium]|nr:hypothetical protein [Actinomycetota bacterium]
MRHEGRAQQVRRCPACGQVRRLGFADETARQGRYGIAVAVVCPCRVPALRKVLRSLVRPGVRRVHFSKQQDRDRREVLSRILCEDFRALFVVSRGREPEARSACWAQLVPLLLDHDVAELAIERMQGGEDRDRRDIRDALVRASGTADFAYRHVESTDDPLLWLAESWRGLRERVACGGRGSLRS